MQNNQSKFVKSNSCCTVYARWWWAQINRFLGKLVIYLFLYVFLSNLQKKNMRCMFCLGRSLHRPTSSKQNRSMRNRIVTPMRNISFINVFEEYLLHILASRHIKVNEGRTHTTDLCIIVYWPVMRTISFSNAFEEHLLHSKADESSKWRTMQER